MIFNVDGPYSLYSTWVIISPTYSAIKSFFSATSPIKQPNPTDIIIKSKNKRFFLWSARAK